MPEKNVQQFLRMHINRSCANANYGFEVYFQVIHIPQRWQWWRTCLWSPPTCSPPLPSSQRSTARRWPWMPWWRRRPPTSGTRLKVRVADWGLEHISPGQIIYKPCKDIYLYPELNLLHTIIAAATKFDSPRTESLWFTSPLSPG